ncbi:MAG: hypothetical protein U0W24_16740 [Bacteroidales bacterium]
MKKIDITIITICIISSAMLAQEKKSAIEVNKNWLGAQTGVSSSLYALKTKTGLILYNNQVFDGYTIQVDSILSVEFPDIELLNGNSFVYSWLTDRKIKEKGDTPKQILEKYMLDGWQYVKTHTRYGHKIKRNNRFIPLSIDTFQQKVDSVNFWHYDIYNFQGETPDKHKTVFYMDGYFYNYFIRFTYYSKSGLEEEAEKDLIRLFKNIRFYTGEIDIEKLKEAIRSGKYSYD